MELRIWPGMPTRRRMQINRGPIIPEGVHRNWHTQRDLVKKVHGIVFPRFLFPLVLFLQFHVNLEFPASAASFYARSSFYWSGLGGCFLMDFINYYLVSS
jgi:hypothetical protein